MDHFKALDCIPHYLLIAKIHAYGFSSESLNLFYSYLKMGKKSVKINNTNSFLQRERERERESQIATDWFKKQHDCKRRQI